MDKSQIGLLTTLSLGVFILIGALIALLVNKKSKIIEFSIGLAFGVIITLAATDLLPEVFECLGFKNIYISLVGIILGFLLLKILDKFIPDHHDHKMTAKESQENLIHIGIITSIAIILHNIIEGMAVYSSCLINTNLGALLTLGIGFHNIPLGMVITNSFYHSNKNLGKTMITILLVALSTFIGGFIMYLFKITEISSLLLGFLLSLTLGMLFFIVFDELFPRIRNMKNKKIAYLGITVGVIILIISMIL